MSEKKVYIVKIEADLDGHEIDIEKYDYIFEGKMEAHFYSTYPLGKYTSKERIELFDKHIPQSLTQIDSLKNYWTHVRTQDVIKLIEDSEKLTACKPLMDKAKLGLKHAEELLTNTKEDGYKEIKEALQVIQEFEKGNNDGE